MNQAERAMDQLLAMIRTGSATSDDIRYLGQWVRQLGAHACEEVREALRAAGRDWQVDLVGQTIV